MSEILASARISDIFLYFGFYNGYVLNRFYGHTGLYGNHHPVKPSMVFFTFHSLPPPTQVRLDVRPSAWYSSLFTFHFPLPHREGRGGSYCPKKIFTIALASAIVILLSLFTSAAFTLKFVMLDGSVDRK